MSDKLSDGTISMADFQKIHEEVTKCGIDPILNRVAERESSLVAYVLCSAEQIAEIVRVAGAPASLVRWVRNEVAARMLIASEAQHLAQQALWRDFMPEP